MACSCFANSSSANNPVAASAKGVGEKAMGYAQHNVHAALDLAQKLVKAKDITEVMALQAAFLKSGVLSFVIGTNAAMA